MQVGLRGVTRNIGITFGRQFSAAVAQLIIILLIAHSLGPEGAGTFAVAMLLPTLLSQLLNLGLTSANVYFLASKQFPLDQIWPASRDLILVMAGVGLALGAALIATLGEIAFPGATNLVLFGALFVFPFSLMNGVVAGLFQAMQDFKAFNLAVITQPILALVAVVILWAFGWMEVASVLAIVALSHGLALAVALSMLRMRTPIAAKALDRLSYLRAAIGYGLKAHLSNILSFLNYRLDLFLVNLLVGPSAAGIYTVAVRLVEQIWMISQAVSTVIFPRLSAMVQNDDMRREFTAVVARTVLWVTLAAAILLALIAQTIIEVLFGPAFSSAFTALLVLLPGIVFFSCARVLANDLASRGRVGINLMLAGLVLAINSIGNLILIPHFGILGAATATTSAYCITLVVHLTLQRYLKGLRWRDYLFPTTDDGKRLLSVIRNMRK
jgi:O-antigen/teichoic acid export membrane protein